MAARRALASAGLAGRAVSVVTPGEVASIVRHGCVVASGGGARATFTGLAWFDLPGGAGTSLPAGVVRP